MYDNYELDFNDIFSSSIKEQHYDEINHFVFAEDIEQQAKLSFDGHKSTFFCDPVVIYMEMFYSEVFSFATFGIKTYCDCKYVPQLKILLQVMRSSLNFICIQEFLSVSWMLSWLHWKHDFTWLASFYWLEVGIDRRISSPYEHEDSLSLFSIVCCYNKLQKFGSVREFY